MVEAVRVGTIVARDKRAAAKWAARRAMGGQGGTGLTGKNLDMAVRMIGMKNPKNIKTELVN